jgi:hypothetical protein
MSSDRRDRFTRQQHSTTRLPNIGQACYIARANTSLHRVMEESAGRRRSP